MKEFKNILTQAKIAPAAVDKMAAYAAMVLAQNTSLNLTRIISQEQMAKEHFLEAVQPVAHNDIMNGQKILDFGTGGGFPGVPIAILCAEAEVTLLDATEKKLKFVQTACAGIGINVQTLIGRGEEIALLPKHKEQFDIVVVRAVAQLNVLMEMCAPFLKKEGRLIAFKGANAALEKKEAETAAEKLYMQYIKWVPSDLPERQGGYFVYQKMQHTPAEYPRRYAKIKAAPL